jgi:carbonic anhydrase
MAAKELVRGYKTMDFCTSIHCIDGRIQEPLRTYLIGNYGVKYVDAITEAGPCKILSENQNRTLIDSIHAKVNISVNHHKSRLIAISGHYDCAGNPVGEDVQKEQIEKSVETLKTLYSELEIIGLWVDNEWMVHRI